MDSKIQEVTGIEDKKDIEVRPDIKIEMDREDDSKDSKDYDWMDVLPDFIDVTQAYDFGGVEDKSEDEDEKNSADDENDEKKSEDDAKTSEDDEKKSEDDAKKSEDDDDYEKKSEDNDNYEKKSADNAHDTTDMCQKGVLKDKVGYNELNSNKVNQTPGSEVKSKNVQDVAVQNPPNKVASDSESSMFCNVTVDNMDELTHHSTEATYTMSVPYGYPNQGTEVPGEKVTAISITGRLVNTSDKEKPGLLNNKTQTVQTPPSSDTSSMKTPPQKATISHIRFKETPLLAPRDKPYRCHLCDKVFPITTELTRHLHSHSPDNLHFSCNMCDMDLRPSQPGASDISEMAQSQASATATLNLQSTASTTSSNSSTDTSMQTSTTSIHKSVVIYAKHFSAESESRAYLHDYIEHWKKHVNGIHCLVCYKLEPDCLQEHVEKHTRMYDCIICGHRFTGLIMFKAHVKSVHVDPPRLKCRESDCKTADKAVLVKHTSPPKLTPRQSGERWDLHIRFKETPLVATADKPYRCHLCNNVTFQVITDLTRHLFSHGPDHLHFSCKVCQLDLNPRQPAKPKVKMNSRSQPSSTVTLNNEPSTSSLITTTDPFSPTAALASLYAEYYASVADNMEESKAYLHRYIEHWKTHVDGNQCLVCQQVKTHSLRDHVEMHTRMYDCIICGEIFTNKTSFNAHVKCVHIELPKFHECIECDYKTPFKSQLLKHTSEKHARGRMDQCDKCGKLISEYRMRDHLRTYHTKRTLGVCEVCGKEMNEKYLPRHMRVHTGEKPYKCEICNTGKSSRYWLRMHIQVKHRNIRQYKCSLCSKAFGFKNSLLSHMESHVGPSKQCNICARLLTSRSALHRHMKLHHGNSELRCDICSKRFLSPDGLRSHKLDIHDKNSHQCDACGKIYRRRYNLTKHACTSSRYRRPPAVKNYTCNVCGRRFLSVRSLRLHLTTHTGQRKHTCPHCRRGFSHRVYLQKHVTRVHGERRYKCHVCHKEYYFLADMRAHMVIHARKAL